MSHVTYIWHVTYEGCDRRRLQSGSVLLLLLVDVLLRQLLLNILSRTRSQVDIMSSHLMSFVEHDRWLYLEHESLIWVILLKKAGLQGHIKSMSMVCNASYSFNLFNLDVRECGQMSYKLCQGEKNIRNSGSQIHKNSRRRSRTCFEYFKMQQKTVV